MQRNVSVAIEHYPIAGSFRIARGAKTRAEVVICSIGEGDKQGRGECVPYSRYGETIASVRDAIEAIEPQLRSGIDRRDLMEAMPPGAARNAVDCALWDLEMKLSGRRAQDFICQSEPEALTTAFTISLNTPEQMAADAKAASGHVLLKVKLGADGDPARMRAVAEAAPSCRLIADANEGWTRENLQENLRAAAENRFELVEQPLPVDADRLLQSIERPVLVCADESAHVASDIERLADLYDSVNIKLDKAGGLTAAIEMRDKARASGLGVMVGCMVGTSLAMAPAVLLAQDADIVDLDGPLLLAADRDPGLRYEGSLVHPPEPALWG